MIAWPGPRPGLPGPGRLSPSTRDQLRARPDGAPAGPMAPGDRRDGPALPEPEPGSLAHGHGHGRPGPSLAARRPGRPLESVPALDCDTDSLPATESEPLSTVTVTVTARLGYVRGRRSGGPGGPARRVPADSDRGPRPFVPRGRARFPGQGFTHLLS
jgi:hypothetical protein